MKKLTSLFALMLLVFLTSCDKDGLWYNHNWEKMHPPSQTPAPNCPNNLGVISYSATVHPLLQTNCSLNNKNCHSTASGRSLVSYASVAAYSAGTSPNSNLEQCINGTSTNVSIMPPPPQQKLAPCDLDAITQWIKQGRLNN